MESNGKCPNSFPEHHKVRIFVPKEKNNIYKRLLSCMRTVCIRRGVNDKESVSTVATLETLGNTRKSLQHNLLHRLSAGCEFLMKIKEVR